MGLAEHESESTGILSESDAEFIANISAFIREGGEDIGQMLPGGEDADWTLDPSISRLRM